MQVKIQRKGHAVEVLNDPTFEQCFNAAGNMQCAFLDLGGIVTLPVTAAPVEASRTVHLTDLDNKAKVEHGFSRHPGEFGQNLPEVWSRGDGGQVALYKSHSTAGVSCDGGGPRYFNVRPNSSAVVPHATFVCDGH